MPASTFVILNTGAKMPTVGLGTWKSRPGDVEHAVEFALKSGYRHIDTAAAYGNEREVGEGIRASGVPREEIFLTTKLNNPDLKYPEAALESSLTNLETSYLDLWLMHWPAPMKNGKADKSHNWIDTWLAMEKIYKAHPEKVRAIGVSNVSIKFFDQLLEKADVIPAVNQIELHPSCMQEELVQYCVSKGISVTAYSPLGSDGSPLLTNPVVTKLAEKYKVTAANVLVSLQANRTFVTVLPKSVTNERILANKTIIDLSPEDVAELTAIEKDHHFRACAPNWTGWGSLGFPDCTDD
ncbi:Glycerol 2-dehydrogenase (NADP(+)) [Sparassis crispa]|uniref:Glycerol 2-dehydrogenase (NADP(+)) n=1 Tax=Sparassis crispa TaxID=139825 RepID=A0A401GP18_9APHY|nr:Glycerol 2-dehydrogenase (NADP(+)) [Sparassis crispa]GBE83967.1 Glycerol 2-dehydrogenase (NADP(+)) [Sparassis crispa]